MGVKGLWRLISSSGTPVPLETLENRILAVDVSIWLHQAVRGFKGFGGNQDVANAHLLTLFHRICKLLFYRIRPVFIFDGGVPYLKRQTLSSRRLKRDVAAGKAQKVRERLLANILKSQAVRKALGKKGPGPVSHHVPKPVNVVKDIFELPPLEEGQSLSTPICKSEKDSDEEEDDDILKKLDAPNIHNFEFESDKFKSLSLETQHEILTDLSGTRKENSWNDIDEMPPEANSFASFQMDRLLKRRKFQETIDNIRSELQKVHTAEMEAQLFGDLEKHVGQSQVHKIISEDSSHSLLFKKKSSTDNKESKLRKQITHIERKPKDQKSVTKDFLTELAKQGLVSINEQNFADSDDDSSSESEFSNSDDDTVEPCRKKRKLEEVAFLKAMDYVLDSNDLTQEEIYNMIQNSRNEAEMNSSPSLTISKKDIEKPSTSANAPGEIFKEKLNESSDSDDDDFIDVSAEPFDLEQNNYKSPTKIETSACLRTKNSPGKHIQMNSNVDAIREVKSDSLYLKIIQSKLNDVVPTIQNKKCSIVDSRKAGPSNSPIKYRNSTDDKNGVTIALNFEKRSISDGPDIFADIFKPKETKTKNVLLGSDKNDRNKKDITHISTKDTEEIVNISKENLSLSIDTIDLTEDLEARFSKLVEEEVKKILNQSTIECQKELNDQNMQLNDKTKILSDAESNSDSIECNDSLELSAQIVSEKIVQVENKVISKNINQEKNDYVSSSTFSTYSKVSSTSSNLCIVDESFERDNRVQDKVSNKTSLEEEYSDNESSEYDYNKPMLIEKPPMYSNDDLKNLEGELEVEQNILTSKVQKIDRVAAEMADHIYTDVQELLQLFGLPYLIAPMEAEAQCAFLDHIGLTHGTITDDSDIFLFGGKKVYKNFFNQTKHVEHFKIENVHHHFGLDREKLISLALLTGSDYTVGIESVGAVLGMEILSEFPGKNMECLKNFKKWWNVAHKNPAGLYQSKTKQRLVNLYLPDSFPSESIMEAYISPDVDESKEKFTWSIPSIDKLQEFVGEKFGWNSSKSSELLIPVFKKLGIAETQMRIDSYFTNIKLVKDDQIKSKRLQDAISRSKDSTIPHERKSMDTLSQKNKGILLVDPSEGTYGPDERPKMLKKKKRKSDSQPSTSKKLATFIDESVVPELSKSEKKKAIYDKLLEQDRILQQEKEKKEMQNKKLLAASILKNKTASRKKNNK